jgi:hypothetical protein
LLHLGDNYFLGELKNSVPEELRSKVIIPELNTGPHNSSCSSDCQLSDDIKVHNSVNLGRAYCEPKNEKISLIVYIGNKGPTLDNFLFTFTGKILVCFILVYICYTNSKCIFGFDFRTNLQVLFRCQWI